jgi:energy-coupling factor transporter ATP-binding protein EcfA2
MNELTSPIIEVRNLHHTYPNGVQALNGISFTVQNNEVLGIIGKNGCGKTTTVKHFNGLLKPTSGEVLVYGQSTQDMTVAQLSENVGMVVQNPD